MNVRPKRGKMNNGFDPAKIDKLDQRTRELVNRRNKLLGPAYRLFYDHPVEFVRASGVLMYDKEGNDYLDAYNNVVSVGHCNSHVNNAIKNQIDILCTHTRYIQEDILNFAEKLTSYFETDLSNLMFTCTGSEANDLAIRIAKYYTGNQGVIVTSEAYHGNSELTSSFSPSMGENTQLGTWVRRVPAPDNYRVSAHHFGRWLALKVSEQIDDLRRRGEGIAAFIVDSLFTSDGVFFHEPGLLQPAIDIVREAGGIFVADEVQCGFARTGIKMWGYQTQKITPDIVTMGKPMGNGYPVAGIVVKPNVVKNFGHDMRYFNTFGGNTVAMAAANATLDVLINENLMENAQLVGAMLSSEFRKLKSKDERIGDIRGAGLYWGIEIVKAGKTKQPDRIAALKLVNELRRRRVLVSATSFNGNVLKIRPPLTFSADNADRFITQLEAALETTR